MSTVNYSETQFYEHCGFAKSEDASPMFITELCIWKSKVTRFYQIFGKNACKCQEFYRILP